MKRRAFSSILVPIFVLVFSLAAAPSVMAHGGLQGSKPGADERVNEAPGRVTMTFSEVPTGDSVMKVVDGCRRDVVQTTKAAGNDLVGELAAGQPGKWKASYRVISAEDGHLTRGSYSFTVGGKKDCTPDGGGENGSGDATESPGLGDPPTAGDEDDEGGSFPVVPVAVGAAGLLIVGLVARRASGS